MRAVTVMCFAMVSVALAQERPHGTNALSPSQYAAGSGARIASRTTDSLAALAAAQARLRDADSVATLTAEGKALSADRNFKSPDNYKYGKHILAERGEFRQAIRSASLALFMAPSLSGDWYFAFAKLGLATAYLYGGDLESAERYASEVFGHNFWPSLRPGAFSAAHNILGDIALRRTDYAKAVKHYEDSVFNADDSLRFYSRAALASARIAGSQFESAKKTIDSAEEYVDIVASEGRPAARSSLMRLRGELALKEGKHQDAIRFFEAALKEQKDVGDVAYDRFWLLDGVGRAKQAGGDVSGALQAYLLAVGDSEKIRSRFRSEEIKTGLLGDMQTVFGKTIQLLMEAGRTEEAWEVSELGRSRALLDMIRNRVVTVSDKTAFADAFTRRVKAAEVAARLNPDEVLVTYHLLPKGAYAWMIRKSGITGVALNTDTSSIALQIRDFRDAIVSRQSNSKELGAKLHDTLVGPLKLAATESLLVAPHDALHYLPFQALWTGEKYLIQTMPISYVPSGGAMVELGKPGRSHSGRIFALGNPDLGDPGMALPGAQREVQAIGKLYPESEIYLQKDATKEKFLQGAVRAGVVHIAAHGTVDSLDPLYSKLHLSGPTRNEGELEAREVYSMRFDQASLVVLSACETGLGKVSRGDEVWGFTRSFLSAGAPAVMVSLWPVADESTEILMRSFHAESQKKADRRLALRSAILEVLADPRFSEPVFWAPFNLVGRAS